MKILATDGFSEKGIELLNKNHIEILNQKISPEDLPQFINDHRIDTLLVRSETQVTQELMDDCPGLKVIGRCGVGLDNIDVDYAQKLGIKIFNTPNASSRSVAELVFAHFLTLARHLHDSNRLMPIEGDINFKKLKKTYSNSVEIAGKTLGIIGMGKIGIEVAKMGISLGMKTLIYDRVPKNQSVEINFFDGQSVTFHLSSTSMEEVLKHADFLSININKSENYVLDDSEFEKMKKGVFIVNAARGGVLNEAALIKHIDSEKVAGAALDVFENEPQPEIALLMNPKISFSPHIGGSTKDAQEKIGIELAEKLIKHKNENASF